jgi:hypothetical protein
MRVVRFLTKIVDLAGTIAVVLGWFGVTSYVVGAIIAIGGAGWALMTGVAAPIAFMGAFCTATAAAYLALLPMAYRTLQRAQETSPRARPDPEIWRHVQELRLYEAACLLADIEPDLPIVSRPGDANGWYRALCEAVRGRQIGRVPTPFDANHMFVSYDDHGHPTGSHEYRPHQETTITRSELRRFAEARGVRRVFLV